MICCKCGGASGGYKGSSVSACTHPVKCEFTRCNQNRFKFKHDVLHAAVLPCPVMHCLSSVTEKK